RAEGARPLPGLPGHHRPTAERLLVVQAPLGAPHPARLPPPGPHTEHVPHHTRQREPLPRLVRAPIDHPRRTPHPPRHLDPLGHRPPPLPSQSAPPPRRPRRRTRPHRPRIINQAHTELSE